MLFCGIVALLLLCQNAVGQVHPKSSGFAERLETLRLRIMFGPPSLGQVQAAFDRLMNTLEHTHTDNEKAEDFEDLTEDSCQFVTDIVRQSAVNSECGRDLKFLCDSIKKLTKASMISCPDDCQCNETCSCEKDKSQLINDLWWVFEVADSIGKWPAGMADGNVFMLGRFHECRLVNTVPANPELGKFQGKYCHLDFGFKNLPFAATVAKCYGANRSQACSPGPPGQVTMGVCVPNSCRKADVVALAQNVMGNDFCLSSATDCVDEDTVPVTHDIVAASVMVTILALILIAGTIMDIYVGHVQDVQYLRNQEKVPLETKNGGPLKTTDLDFRFYELFRKRRHLRETKWYTEALIAFSLLRNFDLLISKKTSKNHLKCLDGLRFFSMLWVIYAFCYLYAITFGDNSGILIQWPRSILFQIIQNSGMVSETFLLLSGCLTCYLWFSQVQTLRVASEIKTVKFWLIFYVGRIVRLLPPMVAVIVADAAIYQYLSFGPLWDREKSFLSGGNCKTHWWANLLFINNFFHSDNQCVGWTWVVAMTFQFHLVAPLFLIFFYKWPKAAAGVVVGLLFLLCIVNGVIVSLSGLPAVFSYTRHPLSWADSERYFNSVFIRPYTRFGTYLVGMSLGYIVWRLRDRQTKKEVGAVEALLKKLKPLLWLISIVSCLSTLFGIFFVGNGLQLNSAVAALYSSMAKPAFAMGIGILVVIFEIDGGFIRFFLELGIWRPLSKLTYSAYLLAPFVISFVFMNNHWPIHLSHYSQFYFFMTNTVLTMAWSFILNLTVEVPFRNLWKLLCRNLSMLMVEEAQ